MDPSAEAYLSVECAQRCIDYLYGRYGAINKSHLRPVLTNLKLNTPRPWTCDAYKKSMKLIKPFYERLILDDGHQQREIQLTYESDIPFPSLLEEVSRCECLTIRTMTATATMKITAIRLICSR